MDFVFKTLCVLGGTTTVYDVDLRCYNQTFDKYMTAPMDQPEPILNCIDRNLVTIFYTFGLNGSATGPSVEAIVKALLATKRYNVVLLDYSKEAMVDERVGVAASYVSIVPKALLIGCRFGEKLAHLTKIGLDGDKVYLIGHSLGAHLFGQTGRSAQKSGFRSSTKKVRRITGLDPAGQLFQEIGYPALDRSCADYVDIVHTDPCNLGTARVTGTADITANICKCPAVQPGCPVLTCAGDDIIKPQCRCSHDRAVLLLSEAVGNNTSLLAASSAICQVWQSDQANCNDLAKIGPEANFDARGPYFLSTRGTPPYGLGEAGAHYIPTP